MAAAVVAAAAAGDLGQQWYEAYHNVGQPDSDVLDVELKAPRDKTA